MTRNLVAPSRRPIVLRPVRPNAGVEQAYRDALVRLVDAMHASLVYWLRAQLRKNTPKLMAADAARERDYLQGGVGGADPTRESGYRPPSPLAALRAAMNRLASQWLKRFDDGAEKLAKWFTEKAQGASDIQLKAILKDAGFSVEFKLSPAAREALGAVTTENVGLIRSIAQQHLTQVEGMVMRSVAQGRDLGALTADLQDQYKVTRKRAALIARDQNNKATAVITRVRQKGLGLTTAIWRHSGAGKEPRPSHVAASGQLYDVDRGMLIDGKWIWPGTEINCRCTAQAVIPGFNG